MQLDHTSHSAIEEYKKCPQRFYLNRILKVESTHHLAGPAGSAFHSMTEDYDNNVTVRPFEEYLQENLEDGVVYTHSRDENYEWWTRTGPIMFDAYRRWRDVTGWEILAVEEEFRIQPDGLEFPVVGFIDRRFRSQRTGTEIICDIKTGFRLPVASAQLPIYYVANLVRTREGGAPYCGGNEGQGSESHERVHSGTRGREVRRLHEAGNSRANVAVNYYDARRGDSTGLEWPGWDVQALVSYVRPVEQGILEDDWTAKPSVNNCRYCPVKQHCQFKKGK